MPKVVWVLLPLLIAAALLVVQLLRGRAPSRRAVNIGASVLLLGYVATTAGLGIFWVANQQLPVFDWHYLFGYGTLTLLALHLAFNLPVVWRFFARRTGAVEAPTPSPERAARRGVLGALGAAAAAGVAFLLGLRHGRSDVSVDAGSGAATPMMADPAAAALALVERFHAFSSHTRSGLLLRAPSADWGDPPAPFKHFADVERVHLPGPGVARDTSFDLAALADILFHTAGVTAVRGGVHLRASPSSGALFSTELYVAARALPGLPAGVWHYDALSHSLARLPAAAAGEALLAAAADARLHDAPALIVATAVFGRTGHKYRDRTYRYVLADLGHALENLRVGAGALGVHNRFAAGFDEAGVAQALGIDEAEEGVLALIGLGAPDVAGPAPTGAPSTRPFASAPADATSARQWRPAAAALEPGIRLGVTAAVHAATSLRAPSAPAAAASAADAAPASEPPQPPIALPPPTPLAPDWLRIIARRRSVRRFAATPLPLQALADVLARMTSHAPVWSDAVRVHVVAQRVAGLAPGAYRYQPAQHALLARGGPAPGRTATRAAALDQDVIGDAAAVFVLSIDRARFAADPLGPARGYRHAFLEAGCIGERVYLEAVARGLGACGVGAFYDAEAAALVGVDPAHEWVVHFAALGIPG